MAFTTGNDTNILQSTDAATVTAGEGNDTYIISPAFIGANQEIRITDTQGTNSLQLVGGLTITSSSVTSNAALLTLSNGATITLLGADSFNFKIGGDPLTGDGSVEKDFGTFATDVLGTSVPAAGADPVVGGESTVNSDGTATGGDPNAPTYTLTAGAASVDEGATATFTLATKNVAEGTEVAYTISGVDAADVTGGSLTGKATVAADGTATISVALAADGATEGAETLSVAIDGQSASASTTVNDTSTSASFTLTSDVSSVTEGSAVTFTVTASTAVVTDTEFKYQVSGVEVAGGTASLSDFAAGSGTLKMPAGATTATFTITPTDDQTAEGFEGFKVSLLDSSFNEVASSSNVVIEDAPETGKNFSLTASSNRTTGGIDNVSATIGDDTIIAVIDTKTATNSTYGSGDQIDGLAGTDTLKVTAVGDGSLSAISGAVVQNVETLAINNSITAGTFTFDTTTVTGLKNIDLTSSVSQGTVVNNLAAGVDASMSSGKGDLTLTYVSAANSGGADSQKLSVSGQTGGTFTANGMETIAVTATGSASSGVTVASSTGTKVTVDGSTDLGLTTAIKTVDASAYTGKLNLTASHSTAQVTGGTGDDTVNLGAIDSGKKFDGGDGNDTLVVTNTSFNSTSFAGVSNVETVSLAPTANSTLDMANISGVSTVEGSLKNTTGLTHSITFAAVDNSGDVITLVIDGVTVTAMENSQSVTVGRTPIATGTTITNASEAATAIAAALNHSTSSLKDKVTASTNAGELIIKEDGVNPVTVTAAANNNITINSNAAGTTYTIAATQATSGSLGLTKVASGATVKLDSSNLHAVATDGSTAQNAALNKMGAVSIGVKDATLSANTSDSLSIELNNNNSTSVATGSTSKVFTATQIDAAGVETVNINSIGSYGATTVSDLNIAAAKTVTVTGTQNLTISALEAADTAMLDASAFTGKLNVTFDATTYKDQTIKGGTNDDTVTMTQLTGGDTIDLGDGTDTLKFTTNADVGIIKATNTEKVEVTTTGDNAAADLRDVTALTTATVKTGSNNDASLLNIKDGTSVTIYDGTMSFNNKGVTLGGASNAKTVALNIGKDGSSSSINGDGIGAGAGMNLTLSNGYTTANVVLDGKAHTGGTDADNLLNNVTTNTVESLNLTISNSANNTINSLVGTKLTDITISGGEAKTDAFVIAALDDNTGLTKIDASGATAAVSIGSNAAGTIFDRYKTKDGAAITTSAGNDIISWDAQNNGANVINSGAGTDTLVVWGNLLAPGVINLASTTDQVSNFNGANAAVQLGFENVNLSNVSGAGVTITAGSEGSTIVATDQADNITGTNAKADTITSGAGNDAINITETSGTEVDTIIFGATATANGNDTITGFDSAGADVFNFDAFLTSATVDTAAVNFVAAGLDLTNGGGQNVGFVFNKGTLASGDIQTGTATSKIAIADNGKAVVFTNADADGTGIATDGTSNWNVYYVQDTDAGAGQTWDVQLVGTVVTNSELNTAAEMQAITIA